MRKQDEGKKFANAASRPVPSGRTDYLKPVDFIRAVNLQLMKGNQHDAYAILNYAVMQHPEDPFILSYYGSLQVIVDKMHRKGIENCIRAIELFKKKSLVGGGFERCAVFYLNLGRACLAAGKKKDAINAFKKGLRYNNNYGAIIKELQKMGTRKRPPLPFLERSNPINKYLGLILYQEKEKHPAGAMIKTRLREQPAGDQAL